MHSVNGCSSLFSIQTREGAKGKEKEKKEKIRHGSKLFPRFLVLVKTMKHTYPWNPRSRKVGVEDFLCD